MQLKIWQHTTQSLVLTFSYFQQLKAIPKLDLSSFKPDVKKDNPHRYASALTITLSFLYVEKEALSYTARAL